MANSQNVVLIGFDSSSLSSYKCGIEGWMRSDYRKSKDDDLYSLDLLVNYVYNYNENNKDESCQKW